MYKAIAFSLRAPYLQSQEGLEQRVVRAKSERRGFHDRQDCSLGFLGCSGGWSESTGAPQPPCTYSHTCMYTLTHTRTHEYRPRGTVGLVWTNPPKPPKLLPWPLPSPSRCEVSGWQI